MVRFRRILQWPTYPICYVIRITGYEKERPVLDGTVAIQPNQWNFDQSTGICSAEIDQDIFALFYKNDLLTPARWPNAKWSDKTVFDNQGWGVTELM